MTPKFGNITAWQQAEVLMQPVFIRVIDNIRKELEQSDWKGSYQNTEVWADEISDETRAIVAQLQSELKGASAEEAAAIEQTLAELPQPQPIYKLHLRRGDREVTVDLWQLCYQICFRNYSPIITATTDQVVEIDTALIDDETGDVDWVSLDTKAQRLIGQIFASLPKESS